MDSAAKDVADGKSIIAAAKAHGIDRMTPQRYIKVQGVATHLMVTEMLRTRLGQPCEEPCQDVSWPNQYNAPKTCK